MKSIRMITLCALVLLAGCGGSSVPTTSKPASYLFELDSTMTWLQQFGTATKSIYQGGSSVLIPSDLIYGVAMDSTGKVETAGSSIGSYAGYSNPNELSQNVLTQFDSSGTLIWLREFGTANGDFLTAISTDSANNIYVTGPTDGNVVPNSNPNFVNQGALYKVSSAGTEIWAAQFAAGLETEPAKLAIGSTGDVLVSGTIEPSNPSSYSNLFVAKFSGANGALSWMKTFGTTAVDSVGGMRVDSTGNIYIDGSTSGTFPGNGTTTLSPFVIKLDTSGNLVWTQQFAGQLLTYSLLQGLTIDQQGDVIISGGTSPTGIYSGFGAEPHSQCVVAKLDPSTGNVMWLQMFGSGNGDQVTDVGVDNAGNIQITGITNGRFVSSATSSDNIFRLKLASDGSKVSGQQFGTGQPVNVEIPAVPQIAVSPLGGAAIIGATTSAFPGFSNPTNAAEVFVSTFAD